MVVVEGGRVVDAGSHAELLRRCPAYQRLHAAWSAQLAGSATVAQS